MISGRIVPDIGRGRPEKEVAGGRRRVRRMSDAPAGPDLDFFWDPV